MTIYYSRDSLKFLNKLSRNELIKRLVKAWDPDFTKAAPEEAKRIADAERSGFVSEADVDWDSIGADA